jgi:hypothetical protein
VILLFIAGCAGTNSETQNSLMAKASSEDGEVILVMDSLHWSSPLGVAVKETFRSITPGLPRPEPLFTVRYIRPNDFRSILQYAESIVIVSVLENNSSGSERLKNFFTPGSLKQIESDTSKFLLVVQDEWARGQEVMYLYGKDEETLIRHINKNRTQLQDHFKNVERRRKESDLYAAKELKEVSNMLLRNHDFSIRVPFGWRIDFEDKNTNFIWLRNPGLDIDKNIWVYYTDYTGPEDFENVIKIRNEATKKYIFDDKEKNDTSYVVVETIVPPEIRTTMFNSKFSVEARGLWKTKNLSMGGPFLSYVFVDEELSRLYYIDGFVYSPSKPQRESVRELEAILKTFKTKSETEAI